MIFIFYALLIALFIFAPENQAFTRASNHLPTIRWKASSHSGSDLWFRRRALPHHVTRRSPWSDIRIRCRPIRFSVPAWRCMRFIQWVCHAYYLMGNHYHLLVETPEANLSSGMRQLNGVYTQDFNRRYHHRRMNQPFWRVCTQTGLYYWSGTGARWIRP